MLCVLLTPVQQRYSSTTQLVLRRTFNNNYCASLCLLDGDLLALLLSRVVLSLDEIGARSTRFIHTILESSYCSDEEWGDRKCTPAHACFH
jgi:hypothetical protein